MITFIIARMVRLTRLQVLRPLHIQMNIFSPQSFYKWFYNCLNTFIHLFLQIHHNNKFIWKKPYRPNMAHGSWYMEGGMSPHPKLNSSPPLHDHSYILSILNHNWCLFMAVLASLLYPVILKYILCCCLYYPLILYSILGFCFIFSRNTEFYLKLFFYIIQ